MKSLKHTLLLQLSLVCGLLFFANVTAEAQATTSIGAASEKVAFVGHQEAVNRLDNALQTLKTQMAGLSQGSQLYKQLDGKYAYYNTIRSIILSDKVVTSDDMARAIDRAMGAYASDAYGTVPDPQRLQNKQSAIDLLKA